MKFSLQWRNKKIAIWGFGKEGTSAVEFLSRHNISYSLLNNQHIDIKNINTQYLNKIYIGNEVYDVLENFDVVIKSPGISPYKPQITQKNITFTSVTNIWFEMYASRYKTIAITGTKGKSTTASLLTYILEKNNIPTMLAGNIGYPLLDPPRKKVKVYVIELSSYQIADLKYSADVNILLNLYPEHLDWHGNVQKYYADKTNLFRYGRKNIINAACAKQVAFEKETFNDHFLYAKEDGIYERGVRVIPATEISLIGKHNYTNICALLRVLKYIPLKIEDIKAPLASFSPLPHRLQEVAKQNGITYIDDSISTTPQSTIAALEVFTKQKIILLVGGKNRGLDWQEFARELYKRNIYKIVTMYESGEIIFEILRNKANVVYASSMKEAIAISHQNIPKNCVVLLSPAAPSYDAFNHYQQKGNAFLHELRNFHSAS